MVLERCLVLPRHVRQIPPSLDISSRRMPTFSPNILTSKGISLAALGPVKITWTASVTKSEGLAKCSLRLRGIKERGVQCVVVHWPFTLHLTPRKGRQALPTRRPDPPSPGSPSGSPGEKTLPRTQPPGSGHKGDKNILYKTSSVE